MYQILHSWHKVKFYTNNNINTNGFTLVETIMYVAMIGVVVASFITYGISVSATRSKTYFIQEVQENMRGAVELISSKVREAEDVISPTEGASSTSLTLDMPGSDPNILFSLTSGVLYMTEGAGSPVAVVSDEVLYSSLVFTNYSLDGKKEGIRIEGTLEYKDSESIEYRYSQNVRTMVNVR